MDNRYKLKFFIEWGGDILWPDTADRRTFEKFDVGPIAPETIGVSVQLCEELHVLEKEWQSSLNWDSPLDPSPWNNEHFADFYKRLNAAFDKLCDELSDQYQIVFCVNTSY